jgi:hypothetical protein
VYSLLRVPVWPDAPTVHVFAVDTSGDPLVAVMAWPLVAALPLPSPGSTIPVFPTPGPANQSSVVQHDAAYFLSLFDRILDSSWITPLKRNAPGSGYEALQAYASIGARISQAVARMEQGNVIMFAAGGSFATGTVEFTRPDASHGAVTLRAGSVVTTSQGGRDFITTQDVAFGSTDVGPIAGPVQAVAPGWQWNVPGEIITARGEVLLGAIDTVKALVQIDPAVTPPTPTFIDPTIAVAQLVATAGGADPMLDGLGADRGVIRRNGETDPAYALRMRTLPDTVSPGAMLRAAQAFLAPYGATWFYVEQNDAAYQTCWNAPDSTAAGSDYSGTTFAYNDTRPVPPFRDRWLDSIDFRGAFLIVIEQLPTLSDRGGAYNDTAETVEQHETILGTVVGRRAVCAFNIPASANGAIYAAAYNGQDTAAHGVYSALWELLQQIKAAGISAQVVVITPTS